MAGLRGELLKSEVQRNQILSPHRLSETRNFRKRSSLNGNGRMRGSQVPGTASLAKRLTLPDLLRFILGDRFHWSMCGLVAAILSGTAVTQFFVRAPLKNIGLSSFAFCLALAAWLPLPLYWLEKHRPRFASAAFAIPWGLALALIIPQAVDVLARSNLPLRDPLLVSIDSRLHVSVPAIVRWANIYWLGRCINATYPLLLWMLPIGLFAPALAGKATHAREYVLANACAFGLGLPIFALMPAIGPWYGYHFAGFASQEALQVEILALRDTVPHAMEIAGVVCFPSFHVIWAVLFCRALWAFRRFRLPVALVSTLVILSTITTGWHYFVDVLAGLLIGGGSIWLAGLLGASYIPPEVGQYFTAQQRSRDLEPV